MVSSTTGHRKPMFEKHWCTKWVPRVYQMGTRGVPNWYQGCTKWAPQVYQMGTTGAPHGYVRWHQPVWYGSFVAVVLVAWLSWVVVRQNPRIRAVFEKGVFKEECVVSLDGTCALFHADKSKLELHVDIVKNIPGAEMHPVQGSYTLWGSEVRGDRLSAGFVVVPRSHQLFDDMWAAREQLEGFKRFAKHFHVLGPDSTSQKEAAFVVQPANSLALWRSEVLHHN